MRLVDYDALEQYAVEYQERHKGDELTRGDFKLIDSFMFECPKTEAIPVEWLEKKRKEALQEGMRLDEVDSVEMVIWMWKKEQEAR